MTAWSSTSSGGRVLRDGSPIEQLVLRDVVLYIGERPNALAMRCLLEINYFKLYITNDE